MIDANDTMAGKAAGKVLLGNEPPAWSDFTGPDLTAVPAAPRLDTDPQAAADDLVKLVLALVETLRQVVERQAIRRVESGGLSDDDVERLGMTLLQLEQRMDELKVHFGLHDTDLSLRLGTVQDLKNVLDG